MRKVKHERVIATVLIVLGVIGAVLFVPLPFSVKSTFEVQPRGAAQIYANTPGTLQEILVKPGQAVKAGDTLVRLDNPELQDQLAEIAGQLADAQQLLENLHRQKFSDPAAVQLIEQAQERVATFKSQMADKQAEVARLNVTAPIDGVVIPVPHRSDKAATVEGRLPGWSGSPLSEKNLGAHFAPSDMICQVGDPHHLEAVLLVDQTYIDLVRSGQAVRVLLDANTRQAFDSKIEEIASTDLKVMSPGLSAQHGGRVEAKSDPSGAVRPLSTTYQARAPLDESVGVAQVGLQGQARIYTGWRSLGSRLYRYISKTFHFDL